MKKRIRVQIIGNYLNQIRFSLNRAGIYTEDFLANGNPLGFVSLTDDKKMDFEFPEAVQTVNNVVTQLTIRKNLDKYLAHDENVFNSNIIKPVLEKTVRYKNTSFVVTDQGVYTSGGIFTQNFERKPFTEISHVNLQRGIFDQYLGVGDVVMTSNYDGYNSRTNLYRGITICDISDYAKVYQLVKKLQTDIFADTMYPNDLRPATNHGYKTKYTPENKEE